MLHANGSADIALASSADDMVGILGAHIALCGSQQLATAGDTAGIIADDSFGIIGAYIAPGGSLQHAIADDTVGNLGGARPAPATIGGA